MNPPDLRDPLTGLGSYRAAMLMLKGSLRCCGQVALLLCDIDRFVYFNHEFGHSHGDDELRRIARDLERICTPSPVFRVGGDEFLVVLPKHSLEEARDAAQQILSAHPPIMVPHEGGSPVQAISFSIGFALFPDHALDAEKLLQAADVALMKLKGQGGPRGPSFPDGTPIPRGNRAMTWGDFLDEFPDQSARFLNPAFVGPRIQSASTAYECNSTSFD